MAARIQQIDHFGKQRAGLLCYIIGMVVILSVYRVVISVVAQLRLFDDIAAYQRHIRGMATFLLILMMGLLWMAYRQWRTIIGERDQLETIIESIGPDVIVAVDKNNRILRCGGAVEQMSGYTPDELIGQKADLLYHERQQQGQSYEIQSAIQHAGFHLGYATGCTKDGEDYLLEIQTSGLRSQDGGAVLILHNLDERQRSKTQLQRRVKMEETFAAISMAFLRSKPEQFEEECRNALANTAKTFDHESAVVGFFDESGRSLRSIWSWPKTAETEDSTLHQDLSRAALSIELDAPTACRFPENQQDASAQLAELNTKWKIRSVVISPMLLQGRRFGFLAMYSKELTRRWVPEDNTILQALASTFLTGELSIHTKLPPQNTDSKKASGDSPEAS